VSSYGASHGPTTVVTAVATTTATTTTTTDATTATATHHIVPTQGPVFNMVHPHYPGLQQLHLDPPVFAVPDFLTHDECDFLIAAASDAFAPAPVVGKGAGEVSPTRTSSTCYLAREDLPDLLRKVSMLTGKPMEHMELPQVGRYLPTQQYYQVRFKQDGIYNGME
jgi:prolyl 4-hydroxylase